ncbi:hypothetical protein PFFVO_04913 [Plasmodium falciparum Vietnam Oak-Knoll (FVO)]|uniref:tRNA/rRNA methyltransferase SpoU type domain-containing protein n=1 Tax=Plasmodium falciparum Vietnam Oak-Knoll (FVO) TaxID=1036723 RepID=A0A024UZP5_PLAFA|nr:hypothetical protein PFFVO_04913 [Plasmodium falciparum Vietnam Oak-Knoll (FVO)]
MKNMSTHKNDKKGYNDYVTNNNIVHNFDNKKYDNKKYDNKKGKDHNYNMIKVEMVRRKDSFKNNDLKINEDKNGDICNISNEKKERRKDNIQNDYFYSEHIFKCLLKLLYGIVSLCSSHSAIIRSTSHLNPFFSSLFSYIKYNKDCKRIRKKIKNQFNYWNVSFFDNIRFLLPTENYSYNHFDEDRNYNNVNTFAHILYNNELVMSYTFLDKFKQIVQQEMSFMIFNIDLEKEKQTDKNFKLNSEQNVSLNMINRIYEHNIRTQIERVHDKEGSSKNVYSDSTEETFMSYDNSVDIKSDDVNKKSDSVNKKSDGVNKKSDDVHKKGDDIDKKSDDIDKKSDDIDKKSDDIDKKSNIADEHIPINYNEGNKKNITNISSEINDDIIILENILEKNKNNYQKKFDPISNIIEIHNEFRKNYLNNKKKNDLIVIASLIDKLPNLAGLCRTCEIFNVKKLLIDNINIIKDYQFQKISSTANKWMNIKELKKSNIINYIIKKKKKYSIIGLEQTHNSQKLNHFVFPKKCILILGDEKEGLPSSILMFLHHCIEIPGQGIIRSLNVHVSAAITIYEYFKQQL